MTFDIIFYLNLLCLNIIDFFFILMLLFAHVDRFSVSRRQDFKVNEMRVDVSNKSNHSNRFKINCLILHRRKKPQTQHFFHMDNFSQLFSVSVSEFCHQHNFVGTELFERPDTL